MKTIEIKIYSFAELSEEAQQVAIENYRQTIYEDYDLLSQFNEDANEQIKNEGWEDANLQYSLSYSQGDGLSFEAKSYNKLDEIFKEVFGQNKEKTAQIIIDNLEQCYKGNRGHYCYSSKGDIDIYLHSGAYVNKTDNIEIAIQKALLILENRYVDLCEKLEKQGYTELEHMQTDEYIREEIEANAYEFTEDGERF